MFPPHRRAEGLGLVLTGSLVGAAGGPVLISIAQGISPNLGIDAIATSWVIVPFLLIPTMILIWMVRPDPKEIAANLSVYYPNLPSVTRSQPMAAVGFRAYWAEPAKRIAFSANALAQGNMAMMMAMTPISLSHHGHGLTEISIAVAIHVMGMFAFSLPLGRLSDRLGRKPLLLGGAIVAALGSVVVPLTPDYWVAALGIFLVGLGWSGVNVAGSAVIADTTNAAQRGRAIGANDTFVGAASVTFPLIGGALVALAGLPALSVFAVLMLAPVAVMILGLKETRPEG
jgi:MFS family permease